MLFNDRVTQSDFLRGGKNCSYFAVAPLEVSRAKLTQQLEQLRAQVSAVNGFLLIASRTKLIQQLEQLRALVLAEELGTALVMRPRLACTRSQRRPTSSSPQVLAEELETALEIKARELGATEALAAAAAELERRLEQRPILPWQRAQYGAASAPDAAPDVDPSMLDSLLASPELDSSPKPPLPPLESDLPPRMQTLTTAPLESVLPPRMQTLTTAPLPLESVLPPRMQTLTTAPPPLESDLPPAARAAPSVTAPRLTKLDEA